MKKIEKYIVRVATWDETPKNMFNQPLVIEMENFKEILNCGNKDTIAVYKENELIYVLSYNKKKKYAILQFFGEWDDNCYVDNIVDEMFDNEEELLLLYMINHLEY